MNNRRAHEVLKDMELSAFTRIRLDSTPYTESLRRDFKSSYFSVWADRSKVSMRGDFSSDQLEAIATWMRDPKGVAEGVDKFKGRCPKCGWPQPEAYPGSMSGMKCVSCGNEY